MVIGFLKKLLPKRREEEKPYFLDKDKISHFYADCSNIDDKVKKVSCLESVKYSLCHVCRKRSEAEIHKITTDFAAHWDSNVAELVDNVSKAEIPDGDKASVLQMGLIYMILTNLTYQLLDNIDKEGENYG